MKYVNGVDILPEELLKEIRKYVEGIYIYIPKSEKKRERWGENTRHRIEMEFRNQHIFDGYLEGASISQLAKRYFLSEKSIHRIILIQKRRMEPKKMMIKEILNEWHFTKEKENVEVLKQISHATWSVNESFIVKEYEDLNQMQRNIKMHTILLERGIPVPRIVPLVDGSMYYQKEDKFYIATTKLEGKNIVGIGQMGSKWFYDFGQILAKLHVAFCEVEKEMSIWNNNMLEEMEGWVTQNIDKYNPEYLIQSDVYETIFQLRKVYQILPRQLIHRDVHLGNFLFDQKQFSGYIDFDLSQSNIRIFDICYFLLGLLCPNDHNHVGNKEWFGIVKQVVEGYDNVVSLSRVERQAISCVMKNIELLFVAYFLGIGDEKLAKDAADVFDFVRVNEGKLIRFCTEQKFE